MLVGVSVWMVFLYDPQVHEFRGGKGIRFDARDGTAVGAFAISHYGQRTQRI